MFELTGKKALVTGASGGIGEAIARNFHAQGATVALHGTRREKLDELAADLGERVLVMPANLSDRDAVKALGQKGSTDKTWERLYVVTFTMEDLKAGAGDAQ